MASDLHVAAAGLVKLVDEPGSLNDYSLAVDAVRDALAAEDAAGGAVEPPAPEPVVAPVVEEAVPAPEAVAAEPVPASDPAHDAAVAAAQGAVADAPVVFDKAAHLAAASADLDAALATWPDSPQLQDLKTQLEALAT